MSSSNSSTIVFPLPIEMMSSFMGKAKSGQAPRGGDKGNEE
jgi:hypothetical protein